MKLFVDDMRKCPKGWTLARTVTEAIRLIDTNDIEEISLDHDITCKIVREDMVDYHASPETFEPVARFLAAQMDLYTTEVCPVVRIHTANFEAGKKMADIIGNTHLLGGRYVPYIFNEEDYA